MRIGIDISQTAYKNTGVANYLKGLVEHLVALDSKNEYVLFFSSLRGKPDETFMKNVSKANVTIKTLKFPPVFLDFLWNKMHVLPIEYLIGDVDIFITSDWAEPPVRKAKKATILYDLIVYKHPEETANTIVATQKRKLQWVVRESSMLFCISEATKKDAEAILHIPKDRLSVVYPGFSLSRK